MNREEGDEKPPLSVKLVDYTPVILGRRGAGKTYMMREMLWQLRHTAVLLPAELQSHNAVLGGASDSAAADPS